MNPILPYDNLAVSWGLFILIWLVQIIIYPGFHSISSAGFAAYHRWYVKRISSIVLPLLIAELMLAIWWVLADNYSSISITSGLLVIVVWSPSWGYEDGPWKGPGPPLLGTAGF